MVKQLAQLVQELFVFLNCEVEVLGAELRKGQENMIFATEEKLFVR